MQGHRDMLPLGLFSLGLRVLGAFLSFWCMKEFGDGIGCELFPRFIHIVTETAIVSSRTLPVSLPLPAISKNSLYMLFCPWIPDHGVSFIISVSGAKILISYILLDTSFYHCLQSVTIRSYFLLMSLQVIQFQYGLEFLRLSYS